MASLGSRTILVVEDEALLAIMIADVLEECGATVIGPACTLAQALDLVEDPRIEAAILDVNLRGEPIHPVATRLHERGVPFAFATGYGAPPEGPWSDAPVLAKPFSEAAVVRTMAGLLGGSAAAQAVPRDPARSS